MLAVRTRTYQFILLSLVIFAFFSSRGFADIWMDPGDILSGTLTGGGGGLITNSTDSTIAWGPFTSFLYEVTRPSDESLPFHYKYTFTPQPDAPSWSHFILQVSDDDPDGLPAFDLDNPMDFIGTGVFESEDPTLYGSSPSNPGIPGTIFGIKYDITASGSGNTVEFDSYRLPMWGDFYTKGGPDPFAYNSGFGILDGANIPVPNSHYVPVPGAFLLGMIGLGAAGVKMRKFA